MSRHSNPPACHGELSAKSLETLKSMATPDESAASLFQRTDTQPFHTGIPFLDRFGVRPGQGLEVMGASGAGKTELLIQLAVSCILPKRWNGAFYGGSEGHVVLLDLDARFDPLRLFQVLDERITATGGGRVGAPDGSEKDHNQELFEDCLRRFHVATCHGSIDVLSVIQSLPLHFKSLAHQQSTSVKLVLIDNLASFYWVDRSCRSVSETSVRGLRKQSPTLAAIHSAAAACVKEILRRLRVALIATKWTTPTPESGDENGGGNNWNYRDYVPNCWQEVLTKRVVLRVAHPPSDRMGMDAESGSREVIFAKWQVPALDEVYEFCVTDFGIKFPGL